MLHALIKQRQRDVERGRDAAERIARLAHDLKVSNHQRDKLAQRFTAKERELGALENRVSPLGSIVPDMHQEKVHLLVWAQDSRNVGMCTVPMMTSVAFDTLALMLSQTIRGSYVCKMWARRLHASRQKDMQQLLFMHGEIGQSVTPPVRLIFQRTLLS